MDKLLTKQDLADRWQVTTKTIDTWVNDRVISPVKGLPSKRFNIDDVLKLEGTELNKLSPLERKRLLKRVDNLEIANRALEKENEELQDFVRLVLGNGAKFINTEGVV